MEPLQFTKFQIGDRGFRFSTVRSCILRENWEEFLQRFHSKISCLSRRQTWSGISVGKWPVGDKTFQKTSFFPRRKNHETLREIRRTGSLCRFANILGNRDRGLRITLIDGAPMDPFPFCCSTTYDSPILWPEDPRIRRVAQTERNAPRACFVMLRFLDVRDEERHCHPGLCDSKSQSWPSRKPREEKRMKERKKGRKNAKPSFSNSSFILFYPYFSPGFLSL